MVEGAALEKRYPEKRDRGFESHSLRFQLVDSCLLSVVSGKVFSIIIGEPCTGNWELKAEPCYYRRDAREAEGARLEIVCSVNSGTVGSNPTLSARSHSRNIDSWVLRNGNLRTPSGPEGSSGSKTFRVPQGSLAINICYHVFLRGESCVLPSACTQVATTNL